jgi:hypothetical protein
LRCRISQPPIGPPSSRENTCVPRSDFGHAKRVSDHERGEPVGLEWL